MRKILIPLVYLLLVALYAFIATNAHPRLRHTNRFYNWQVDAFLAGQIHLPVRFDPSRILNPDNTVQGIYDCAGYAWNSDLGDLSTHNGKVYMYWGVTPVLCLYLPYRLLSGMQRLPDQWAVFIFCAGALFYIFKILFFLKERYFSKTPDWLITFSSIVIGLSNVSPFLIRTSQVYEVPISALIFFLTASLYYYFRAVSNVFLKKRDLLLGSLCLGLAYGCRPYLFLAGLPLIFLMLIFLERSKKLTAGNATVLIGPPFICMGLIFFYNYIRFGSAFDFGAVLSNITFILYGYILKEIDFAKIIPNIYLYLLHPPGLNSQYPFAHLTSTIYVPIRIVNQFCLEPTAGLFFVAPFSLLLFAGPFIYFLKLRQQLRQRIAILRKAVIQTVIVYFSLVFMNNLLAPFHNSSFSRIVYFLCDNSLKEIPVLWIFFLVLFTQVCLEIIRQTPPQAKTGNPFVFAKKPFILLIGLIAGLIVCLSFFSMGISFRYAGDYTAPVLLLASILWFYFDGALEQRPLFRNCLRIYGVMLGVLSVLFGLAFAITGYVV
jgi:hypothetical protein